MPGNQRSEQHVQLGIGIECIGVWQAPQYRRPSMAPWSSVVGRTGS
jgi:hypothetical protein